MKVALVHDWLNQYGGAERVLASPVRRPSRAGELANIAWRTGAMRLASRHCCRPASPGSRLTQTCRPAVWRIIRRPQGPIRSKCSCILR